MRKIYNYSIFFLALLLVGCSSDDKVFDQVQDTKTFGAILRTVSTESGTFNAFDETSTFGVTLEEQDEENGGLLESLDVFLSFTDFTDDGVDNSASEILIETIPASAFSPGENGLPVISYEISLEEARTALGLNADDYNGGDRFTVRFAVNLTDGRTFSAADASGNVASGSYFRSPYAYSADLVCPSNLDVPFTWVATDFFFQGGSLGDFDSPSGTDTLVKTSSTSYTYGSGFFDFGYYCIVYNGLDPDCGSGAAGSLELSDVCGKLTYSGADQYGDPWTISNVSVDGSDLTFTWESAYGERSTVTLTRTDGDAWPDTLFSD